MFELLDISAESPDIDIINKIATKGMAFFESNKAILNHPLSNDHKYFINYLVMYVIYDDLFEDCNDVVVENKLEKFCDFILSEKLLFTRITECSGNDGYIDDEQLLHLFNSITTMLIHNTTKDKKFMKLAHHYFKYDIFIFYLFSKQSYPNYSVFIRYFSLLNKKDRTELLFKIAKNKNTRPLLLEFWNNYYTKSAHYKNLSNLSYDNMVNLEPTLELNVKILSCLFELYYKGCSLVKVEKFKFDGISINSNQTFLNKLFFIIIKFVELSFINPIQYVKQLTRSIYFIKDELDKLKSIPKEDCDQDMLYKIKTYSDKLSFYEKKNNMLEKSVKSFAKDANMVFNFISQDLVVFLNTFYTKKLEKLASESSTESGAVFDARGGADAEVVDDLLNIVQLFIDENNSKINASQELYMLSMNVFDNTETHHLTLNPDIKVGFLSILVYYIIEQEYVIKGQIHKNCSLFYSKLVDLYIFLDKCEYIDDTQIKIILIFLRTSFVDFLQTTPHFKVSNRFINIFLGKILTSFDTLTGVVRNIHNIQHNQLTENENPNIHSLKPLLEKHKLCFNTMMEFLTSLVKTQPEVCLGEGVKEKFTSLINYIVHELVGSTSKSLKISISSLKFKVLTIMFNIFEILHTYRNNNVFKYSIIEDSRFYNSSYIEKFMTILLHKQKILVSEYNNIKLLLNKIDKFKLKLDKLEEYDIPEKYCDPIMGTIIKTPVILPECDIMMDKDIIMRYLLEKEENPFNRTELTAKQLEEFNKIPETINKCDKFKLDLQGYLETIDV
jgi:hypothetical protein